MHVPMCMPPSAKPPGKSPVPSPPSRLRPVHCPLQEINSEWQNAACQLMVELCCLCPDPGNQLLISQIPTMQLPHYFVIKCLADFAHASRM